MTDCAPNIALSWFLILWFRPLRPILGDRKMPVIRNLVPQDGAEGPKPSVISKGRSYEIQLNTILIFFRRHPPRVAHGVEDGDVGFF